MFFCIAAKVQKVLCDRIKNLGIDQVPLPYRIHKPVIEGTIGTKIPRPQNMRTVKYCMNWVICNPDVEFVDKETGKTKEGELSRLCKFNMFIRFMNTLGLISNRGKTPSKRFFSYQTFKEKASTYQRIKKMFYIFLEENGYGKWVQKPKELGLFFLKDE